MSAATSPEARIDRFAEAGEWKRRAETAERHLAEMHAQCALLVQQIDTVTGRADAAERKVLAITMRLAAVERLAIAQARSLHALQGAELPPEEVLPSKD